MGVVQFWRCDTCGQDRTGSVPIGWRLKGERIVDIDRPARQFDLFFCDDACALAWFQAF